MFFTFDPSDRHRTVGRAIPIREEMPMYVSEKVKIKQPVTDKHTSGVDQEFIKIPLIKTSEKNETLFVVINIADIISVEDLTPTVCCVAVGTNGGPPLTYRCAMSASAFFEYMKR